MTEDAFAIRGYCPSAPATAVSYTHLDVYKRQVFDARLTNQGDAPVEIPDRAETGGVAGIFQNGVESQQSDESWRTVEHGGDLLWKGDTVFPLSLIHI